VGVEDVDESVALTSSEDVGSIITGVGVTAGR
jgi:hypothetical protein